MNKFVKYPLVLGIVGLICTGALSIVYEATKQRISDNKNAIAKELISGIIPDVTLLESVYEQYDTTKAATLGVTNMYTVDRTSGDTVYGYLAEVTGYNPGINFLLVVNNENILGFSVVSHQETNSGTYGGPLLNSPEFAAQFKDIPFDSVGSEVDFVAGSTAKTTLNAVKTGVANVVKYHKQAILGEADDGIALTPDERKMLELPEGQTMTDKTQDFKDALKANTKENKYKEILGTLKLINYLEFTDASGAVKGHAYVVEGSYSCDTPEDTNGNGVIDGEDNHGVRTTQTYKFAFKFDENGANTKIVIIASSDSMGAILPEGKPSITEHEWVNVFNNTTIDALNSALAKEEIDYIHGATFTSQKIREHMTTIVDAHTRAYKK